ncbi:hypothetical protein H8S95_14380 [Pontibacter sp. KCTC 32443]|uniref:hypothetical protein n=1 Tax=Pontibacter TaxID=323449 RepID=UPI00164E8EB9|nr:MULTISPECIES: hypothetical protein [Pontibacter]MBC5775262.1 hypothetical protein [Pontibacter sp. KCTC 32443]
MGRAVTGIIGLVMVGLVSCTSLSEGEEGAAGVEENRRTRYRGNANADLRDQMDEQSSDINRKKNIEENRNGPGMKPPEVRPERLPNSPVDTTKHTPRPVAPRRGGN